MMRKSSFIMCLKKMTLTATRERMYMIMALVEICFGKNGTKVCQELKWFINLLCGGQSDGGWTLIIPQ